jgi:hypothetical protein
VFNVSRTVLVVVAVIAVAAVAFGIAASFFPGWVAGIILGAYVIVALIKQRSAKPSSL